jgi:hypothetical protein
MFPIRNFVEFTGGATNIAAGSGGSPPTGAMITGGATNIAAAGSGGSAPIGAMITGGATNIAAAGSGGSAPTGRTIVPIASETAGLVDELTLVLKRYEGIYKIIILFCELAISRKDRFKGQVTKEYIKKNIPTDYNEEDARRIFDQLKQDAANKKEILFAYKGTSLVLTDLGNKYYEYYVHQSNKSVYAK